MENQREKIPDNAGRYWLLSSLHDIRSTTNLIIKKKVYREGRIPRAKESLPSQGFLNYPKKETDRPRREKVPGFMQKVPDLQKGIKAPSNRIFPKPPRPKRKERPRPKSLQAAMHLSSPGITGIFGKDLYHVH